MNNSYISTVKIIKYMMIILILNLLTGVANLAGTQS